MASLQSRQTGDRAAWAILAGGAVVLAVRFAMPASLTGLLSVGGMEMTDVLLYVALPALLLLAAGENPLGYVGIGDPRAVRWWLLAAMAAVLVSAVLLAWHAPFRAYYAAARPSGRFLVQSLIAITSVEFFFRGALLQRPYQVLGWPAVAWSTALYVLIHVGKPPAELGGSVLFGAALAYLAVRSRSIWYGVALHWLLAVGVAVAISATR